MATTIRRRFPPADFFVRLFYFCGWFQTTGLFENANPWRDQTTLDKA
jgi:hypothetical protein